MGFQQGLSGLNAASKNLDTIGNNVANSGTVGFKASQTQFADVFANSLTGSGGLQVGIGTKVAAVAQQFTQGNISVSNNPLDMAISGKGFYRMSQSGAITYARNGQFQMDKNGYIVNSNGLRATGYLADANGTLIPSNPQDIQISAADLSPQATGAGLTNPGLQVSLNLDSRETAPITTPFSPGDVTSYTSSTAASVFDSLGNAHTYTMYFVKQAAPNTWAAYTTLTQPDGTVTPVPPATSLLGTLTFDANGAISPAGSGIFGPVAIPVNTGANPLAFNVNFTGSTQFGGKFGVNALAQDGYASGSLSGFGVSSSGIVQGRYTNGQSRNLAQFVLANFVNPQGLQPLGDNQWAETSASGQPLVGAPGSSSLGVMQSGAVEESNVDLTAELVNMITAQRVYQANAQTIKTQDAVLQTLVNLR